MAEYKDKNGTTRVGDFLRGLGDVGKPILQAAAGLTGQQWLNNIASQITTSKELQQEHKQLALELYKQDIEDTKNARNNETARDISQYSSWMSKNVHEIIAFVIIGGWISTWFLDVKIDSKDVLQAVLLILGYLYGRTKPQN